MAGVSDNITNNSTSTASVESVDSIDGENTVFSLQSFKANAFPITGVKTPLIEICWPFFGPEDVGSFARP